MDLALYKKNGLTVVAFHTPDKLYTTEAKRMKATADNLNIPVYIKVYESEGNWVKNANIKAKFLLEMRQKIQGPILYVDVDAIFHKSPINYLLNLSCDLAVHFHCADNHLMSGTMYINDTENALLLLKEWVKYCALHPDTWDQVALHNVLKENQTYQYVNLPVEFCWVFDDKYNLSKTDKNPIYIEHLQASRSAKQWPLFKRIIKAFSKKNKLLRSREKRIKEIHKNA